MYNLWLVFVSEFAYNRRRENEFYKGVYGMKKRIFMSLFVFVLLLAGCGASKEMDESQKGGYPDQGEVEEENDEVTLPTRKIIYEVNATINTKDTLNETVDQIRSDLGSDGWFDLEEIGSHSVRLVIRVKTEKLDVYLKTIFKDHEISDYKKTATDISLKYQDLSNRLLTLQTERERLLELYEEASISDMITINKRISEIDTEIRKIEGELNQFDSLVEYSKVSLTIYPTQTSEKVSYGKQMADGLNNGFFSLVAFLKVLLIVLITLLPWSMIIVPSVFVIIYINKKNKKKREERRQNENPQNYYNQPKDK